MIGFDHRTRLTRLRESMHHEGVEVTLLSVGPDLPYFSGYKAVASERLTVLVVSQGTDPVLVVPELEAPRVGKVDIEVRAWKETDDPVVMAGGVIGEARRVAVGDHMRSSHLIEFQRLWPHGEWRPASDLTAPIRMRKDDAEIAALRRAAQAVDRVMGRIPKEVRFLGRSESQVARDLAELTIKEGHDTADFTIVASGPNGASPHHDPGDRVIEVGDVVVCDFGGCRDGYYSDSTRTFSVGVSTTRELELHDVVFRANEAGRRAVEPGATCESVDRAARQVIDDAGFGEAFVHRTGHGIGLEVHEHPYIVEGNRQPLETGMTFSVEPGIYLTGDIGIRIEDIVVCIDEGVESLNESERHLVTVE